MKSFLLILQQLTERLMLFFVYHILSTTSAVSGFIVIFLSIHFGWLNDKRATNQHVPNIHSYFSSPVHAVRNVWKSWCVLFKLVSIFLRSFWTDFFYCYWGSLPCSLEFTFELRFHESLQKIQVLKTHKNSWKCYNWYHLSNFTALHLIKFFYNLLSITNSYEAMFIQLRITIAPRLI